MTDKDPTPDPKPDPKPDPDPDPDPDPEPKSGDLSIPTTDPQKWEIIRAQGNTSVTLLVSATAQRRLVSFDVVAQGLVPGSLEVDVLLDGKVVALSSVVSPATSKPLDYTFRITDKVAENSWETAAIKSIRYRLEGDTTDTTLPLGNNGNGILLKDMNMKSKPQSNTQSPDSSGGCNAGFAGLLLLAAAPLVSRRKR